MSICFSFKNKTSSERCSSKSLNGLLFCRRHSRYNSPRNWFMEENRLSKIIKIQKVWRGYFLRFWLKLAGTGVINRKLCSNNEELCTLDDRNSVDPLWYFSFEEDKNVWWFDIRTIWESTLVKNIPDNPFNRNKLTIETRTRLRKLAHLHSRRLHWLHHDKNIVFTEEERNIRNWRQVSQILDENGFYEISPMLLNSMNTTQSYIFLTMLLEDMKVWANEHSSKESRRNKYIMWISCAAIQIYNNVNVVNAINEKYVSFLIARLLLTILNDCQQNYPVCFMIMTSFYRL